MKESDKTPRSTVPAQNPSKLPEETPPPKPQAPLLTSVDETFKESRWRRYFRNLLIGKPHDLGDEKVYNHLSLIALFAWVGLGADGLSSSCYGPSEAFHHLGEHSYLAVFLSIATVATVFIISICYTHIIEEFPSGGGGYLVASKVLGKPVGVVSGSALLIDYVLTITVSIAAAGDALFGLLSPDWQPWKLTAELAAILFLVGLNLRGVKESIMALLPIFALFLVTHVLIIAGTMYLHVFEVDDVARDVAAGVQKGMADPKVGLLGMMSLLFYAYSFGAGTYTGIEAVSNSMPVMREPRVATAKRTMVYMACSLSFMAGGLMVSYLLLGVTRGGEETMNQILTTKLVREVGFGGTWEGGLFILITMIAEGALLVVAAQAGFIDGPRVLANMARDSWMPHWFANLSDRLANHNGIVLMGGAALAALLFTGGQVERLLIMYSINVFLTFSLSMIAMSTLWFRRRATNPLWKKRLALFLVGTVLCLSILSVTVIEKFEEGGYITLGVTGVCVAVCFAIHREYSNVRTKLRVLNRTLGNIAGNAPPNMAPCDPNAPTAAILVGGYGGLGVHTYLNALRLTPNYFKNVVFLSVGVLDSGNFKGAAAAEELKHDTQASLDRYVELSRRVGMPADSFMALGTDPADELERLCVDVAKKFPKAVFFAGQLVFHKDKWYHRLLHNETAFSLQRRLQWTGLPIVILPTRVR